MVIRNVKANKSYFVNSKAIVTVAKEIVAKAYDRAYAIANGDSSAIPSMEDMRLVKAVMQFCMKGYYEKLNSAEKMDDVVSTTQEARDLAMSISMINDMQMDSVESLAKLPGTDEKSFEENFDSSDTIDEAFQGTIDGDTKCLFLPHTDVEKAFINTLIPEYYTVVTPDNVFDYLRK